MIRYLRSLPKTYYLAAILVILLPCISLIFTLMVEDEDSRVVISDLFSPGFNLIATGSIIYAAIQTRKISKRIAQGWGILALAQLSYTIGDINWAILEVGYKVAPFPSISDAAYLLFYPLFFLGISLFLLKKLSRVEWFKTSLDIGIVLIAAILGYWIFLINPILQQKTGAQPLEIFLTAAYPIGDLLLIFALLLILYYRTEKMPIGSIWLLTSGSIAMIITDSVFSFQSLSGTYASGGILDLGWMISYMLTALAGIYQTIASNYYAANNAIPNQILVTSKWASKILSYLPYVWVAAAYSLLFLIFHNTDLQVNFDLLFVGVGIIICLVIIRQVLVLRENGYLLSNLRIALEQVKQQASELDVSNTDLRQEITHRNLVEAQLAHDALHDKLTGLANRILFMDRLGRAIDINRREPKSIYSILFMDLDNFKIINDGLGHSSGDQALIEVGQRLRKCTRTIDTIARLGGDEFVILIENNPDKNAATTVAHRILAELDHPFIIKDNEVRITCSIGIVQGIMDYTNPEDILRDADITMYRAKEKGKARFELFNLDIRSSALHLLKIESELRRAILNHEFVLYFQPIYSLENSNITGLEVLIRWNHPVRGLLMPSAFIDIAEKSGLILPLGDWVLFEACSQLRKWHHSYPNLNFLSLNVNVSGKQITQPDFVEKVERAIRITGIDPKKLKLEITENTFVENQAILNDLLFDLRKLGVAFIIDDFGTGYSSLAYLKNIPVNTIKIDKSFIAGILDNAKDFSLIKAIILMAEVLGMDAVAEGIENSEQLQQLKAINCKYGQGFFLSKPMNVILTENTLKLINSPENTDSTEAARSIQF